MPSTRSFKVDERYLSYLGDYTSVMYACAHNQLYRRYGSASRYACNQLCGRQASDWAWIHDTCTFVPLCKTCHIQYDHPMWETESWLHKVTAGSENLDTRCPQAAWRSKQLYIVADGYKWVTSSSGDNLAYEPHEASLEPTLRELLGNGVFFDVGAHVGRWSVRLAAQAAWVIAIEANPRTYLALNENLSLNNIRNVYTYLVAAWDTRTLLHLYDPFHQQHGGSTRTLPEGDGVVVNAMPLDDLLPHDQRVDLIKLDVEGADIHALRGMSKLVYFNRPTLLIERHDTVGYYKLEDLTDVLREMNYMWEDGPHYMDARYLIAKPKVANEHRHKSA